MSRYKRYDRYKDSGVEWIGEIPEHWELSKLKSMLLINDGGTWGEECDDEEGTIVLRSTEIKIDGSWDIQEPARRKLSPKEKKRCLLKKGDLLVTKSSGSEQHIGKTAIVNEDVERLECVFSNFMQRLRVKRNICPSFVYYFINSHVGRTQLQYLSTTTTGLGNLTSQILDTIIIPYGRYNEQTAIANFLDQKTGEIDNLIADKEKMIQLLQEKRQTIIIEAVTKGLDPNVSMKDSGVEWIGEIPAHWEVEKIKYLVQFITKKARAIDNHRPYIGLENIQPRVGKLDLNINGDEQFIESESLLFEPNDVLFSKLRPYLAKCIVADFYGRCTSELFVIRKKERILSKYLYYLMLSNKFIEIINSSTYGAKMPRVNWEFVRSLKMPLPSLCEQENIINFLDQKTAEIDSLISDIQTQIDRLKEYRQSLIYEAVTGKIDVRDFVPDGEGVAADA